MRTTSVIAEASKIEQTVSLQDHNATHQLVLDCLNGFCTALALMNPFMISAGALAGTRKDDE